MKVWIVGIAGHMGQAVLQLCRESGVEIAGGIDRSPIADADVPVLPSFDGAPVMGDAIIDFSRPETLASTLRYATENRIPAVIATTGFTPAQLAAIDEAAKVTPIFRSANMSVGIALIRQLARKAAQVLGDGFDVEIVEAHHNRKADAPSGTALMLYDAVKDAFNEEPPMVCGRSGSSCKRQKGEIGVHSLRGGTVTGEHEVCFFGPMERVRICHSAENRAVFAAGALKAAAFLRGRQPGLYTMDDLVG